jgi:hypothetical protein
MNKVKMRLVLQAMRELPAEGSNFDQSEWEQCTAAIAAEVLCRLPKADNLPATLENSRAAARELELDYNESRIVFFGEALMRLSGLDPTKPHGWWQSPHRVADAIEHYMNALP